MFGGSHHIQGNFFCTEEPNWKKELIGVPDGGDCFFGLEYNVDTGEFVGGIEVHIEP
jgi:hypothetical protein